MFQNSDQLQDCPVCGEQHLNNIIDLYLEWPISRFECGRCGVYEMNRNLAIQTIKPWQKVSYLVSAWIWRENKANIVPRIGQDASKEELNSENWWIVKFTHMGFPQETNEKLNAVLLAFSQIVKSLQENIYPINPQIVPEVAARNIDEVTGLTHMLIELGYISQTIGTDPPSTCLYISTRLAAD